MTFPPKEDCWGSGLEPGTLVEWHRRYYDGPMSLTWWIILGPCKCCDADGTRPSSHSGHYTMAEITGAYFGPHTYYVEPIEWKIPSKESLAIDP